MEELKQMDTQKAVVDDLESLLDVMPIHISQPLRAREDLRDLLEVVLDLGRLPEARFPGLDVYLSAKEVTEDDLEHVTERIGTFGEDNRAGIERTLHRISAIRNRRGRTVGITCRVGRAVFGTIKPIEDLVRSDKSILLLGRPGVGKTTMLREVARVLADEAHKRVIVVDTSNEIAGDGDIPHSGIGHARRMQVPKPALQHDVMIEAVENHMPQVIIIDEMGTELEATAARTIAERGVQLIATAHGNTLKNLIMNPTLSDLIGGMQSVILGDEEARRRRTQKTVLERKRPPTFDSVVEIQSWGEVAIHDNVAYVVDDMLRGLQPQPESRSIDSVGRVQTAGRPGPRGAEQGPAAFQPFSTVDGPPLGQTAPVAPEKTVRVYPFGVNRGVIEQVVRAFRLPVAMTDSLESADLMVTTKTHFKRNPKLLRTAEEREVPVHVLRKNSKVQVEQFLKRLGKSNGRGSYQLPHGSVEEAMQEAQDAVEKVWSGMPYIELQPQRAYIRRQQHLLANRYNVASQSIGAEPERRVIVFER